MQCNDFRELTIRYSFYFDHFPLICLCVFFVYDRVHVEVTLAIVTFRGLALHRKKTSEKLFECTRKNDE